MILRARVILPITQPPILDGAIWIYRDRIRSIGRARDFPKRRSDQSVDLGDVVLLPGFINAHCHLDYTNMAGQFAPPRLFTDWLKLITTTKSQWTTDDYLSSWQKGAGMLLRTGTTTVGDIEAVPELLPRVWKDTPLRIISFLEMIGLTPRRPPAQVVAEALKTMESLAGERCQVGLSPHAPYTAAPGLFIESVRLARRKHCLLCTHVAESKTEFAMFSEGKGEMFDWLRRSGRDMTDCGHGSPVQHLERLGVLRQNLLATHVNYLARGDAALLAKRRVTVVHCPRSHSYFSHDSFPLRRLLNAGVNICLGTDSLASVIKLPRQDIELDMLSEMRVLADRQPWLSAHALLRMCTVNAAHALGKPTSLGRLAPGACADLIALPFSGKAVRLEENILQHKGPVSASMIGGTWAIAPS